MTHQFGYIFVNSLFIPENEAFSANMKQYAAALQEFGGIEMTTDNLDVSLPLLYFMATGGTEQVLLDIRDKQGDGSLLKPLLVVAHPAHNSLPAALEVMGRIQQDGQNGQVLYLKNPTDQEGLKKITEALVNHEVASQLKQLKIGLVGAPSDWLVASRPEHATVKKTWGPDIIPVSLEEINTLIGEVQPESIPEMKRSLTEDASEIREPSSEDLDTVVKVYFALKQIIEKYGLDALTVRCFDLVLGLQTTGCFALSQLTDEGIIAGCEGDLMSTMGMLWANKLLGETPWMANPAQLDESNNKIILAHCTIPRSMIKDYGLRSHFESGLGVGIQGTLPKGPVTLLRIGGKNMDKLWLAEGEVVQAGFAEDLCRTQAEIKIHQGQISELLLSPLGNHLVMVQGQHLDRLHAWWKQMIACGGSIV